MMCILGESKTSSLCHVHNTRDSFFSIMFRKRVDYRWCFQCSHLLNSLKLYSLPVACIICHFLSLADDYRLSALYVCSSDKKHGNVSSLSEAQQEKILLQHRQTEQLRMEKSWQGKNLNSLRNFFNEFLILSMVDLPLKTFWSFCFLRSKYFC